MEATLLINFDDILHCTGGLRGNIDVEKINPHIYNAQILYLEPLLGSSLYEKIISLVNTGDITGTTYAVYKTLLDEYITPSIAFHAVELYIPLNAFQVADGGTYQFQATNSITSPLDDIDRIAIKYKIIGSKYDSKLSNYLCKHENDYIEYINNTGLVGKTEATPRIGWYLGNSRMGSKIRM